MNKIGQVTFEGWNCDVILESYLLSGRKRIVLVDSDSNEDILFATIDLPEVDLLENEVMIVVYPENKKVYDVLFQAKIVSKLKKSFAFLYFRVIVCELLIK